MRFEAIDGCPVPSRIAPVVRRIKVDSGATLVSCYRGSDPKAASILRRFGKSTQYALWRLFLAGRGNPANPPGFSTHELFNDGVAYRVPRGTPLRAYQVGMDWGHSGGARAVCAIANRLGYSMTVTYPNNPRERHHANLRKEPKISVFRSLRKGSKGARVEKLTRRLMLVPDPDGDGRYLNEPARHYTERVARAVRDFQRDHGQKADGVYGPRTHRQLMASVRYHTRKRKKRS